MFAFAVVKWRNLKSPVSSAAIQVGLFAPRATFNSRAILLLLTLMSNDVVTQGSARSRLILNTPNHLQCSWATRKFCQSEIPGDWSGDGELGEGLCTVDLAGGRLGWQATTTTPQSPSAPPPPTDAEDAAVVGSEYLSLGIVHLVSLTICYLYVGLFELTYVTLTSEICGHSNLRRVGLDEDN